MDRSFLDKKKNWNLKEEKDEAETKWEWEKVVI